MNTLTYINNNIEYKIRVSQDEQAQLIFVAKDIAKAIGYKDTTNALKKYVADQHKHFRMVQTSRGIKKMVIIAKEGLHDLLSAKRFDTTSIESWLYDLYNPVEICTAEFLPAAIKRSKQCNMYDMLKTIYIDLDIQKNVQIGLYKADIYIEEFDLIIETTDIERKMNDKERENEIEHFISHKNKVKYEEIYDSNANFVYVEQGNEFKKFREISLTFEKLNGIAATDYMKKQVVK